MAMMTNYEIIYVIVGGDEQNLRSVWSAGGCGK